MAYTDHLGDIFKVTMAFSYSNSQVQEIGIHYQIAAAGVGDSRSSVLGYVATGVNVYLLPGVPSTAHYYGAEMSAVKSLAPVAPVVLYDGTAGGVSGNMVPTQVRGLMTWRTQYAGRAYRGRSYLPSTTVSNVTSVGKPLLALLTNWQGWGTYMLGPVVAGGTTWVPGIFHRKPTAVISSVFDQFTAAVVGPAFATQRRSGDYGRLNPPPF